MPWINSNSKKTLEITQRVPKGLIIKPLFYLNTTWIFHQARSQGSCPRTNRHQTQSELSLLSGEKSRGDFRNGHLRYRLHGAERIGHNQLDNVASEDGANSGKFTITRAGGTLGDIYVNLTIADTATSGTDYTGLATPVLIPDGQASTVVEVFGVSDSSNEGDEGIEVSIDSGTGYNAGSPSSATVTLEDDDSATVTIATTDSIAHEADSGNKAVVRISRTGSTAQALVVSLRSRLALFYFPHANAYPKNNPPTGLI